MKKLAIISFITLIIIFAIDYILGKNDLSFRVWAMYFVVISIIIVSAVLSVSLFCITKKRTRGKIKVLGFISVCISSIFCVVCALFGIVGLMFFTPIEKEIVIIDNNKYVVEMSQQLPRNENLTYYDYINWFVRSRRGHGSNPLPPA
ncbi:MAG: hypothetical protein LBC82_07255 [Oscillospiraceae bacterium]|nr:hypothetical protein [Oscillospiraceae bacterium]